MILTLPRHLARPATSFLRCLSTQYLITNESNGTREITLNHEKTKNSLSLDMMSNLIQAINTNKDDSSLRAIVLSAKGNVFSAGHNLKELQSSTGLEQHKLIFNKATELMKAIVCSPVPVIAKGVAIGPIGWYMLKVNGFAAAAGCQLVATCDMVVCSDASKFSTPGANFGVFCSTPGVAVARSIPKSRATYMLFTGEPLTAKEAYESGLVTKVVPASDLDNEVEQIIKKIRHKSRSVISLGKQFFYKQIDLGLFEAYKLGEDVMVENINSSDGQEGIKSFVDKRKANWSHK